VCVEWNDYNNASRGSEIRAACDEHDLIFTIWLTRPFDAASAKAALLASGCEAISLEGEIPAESAPGVPNPQAVDWQAVVDELEGYPIPKSVVTNFAPFTHHNGAPYPEKAAPLIADGWRCLTECYDMTGDPAMWPERRAFFATHLGWDITQPVLGAYGGNTVESYPTRHAYPNWSVWAAEYVL